MILGASGMLGAMLTHVLSQNPKLGVTATVRRHEALLKFKRLYPQVDWQLFDASAGEIPPSIERQGWVINAIGITKPYIDDEDPLKVRRAIQTNALFPHHLASWAEEYDFRVIQIATDCVYSGSEGAYHENHQHDALDVYGKTKSLGEVKSSAFYHLRCSIIGPEPEADAFLMAWFKNLPNGGQVTGFTNHVWNGVTTLQFAKLCEGIIVNDLPLPNLQHVIPGDTVSKYELLKIFARSLDRSDVIINPGAAKQVVDRTLATGDEASNANLWLSAGYSSPPTIASMVEELAACRYDFA
ncbi:MAG: sugar nucleotide-binding protein [Chloroflexota bacterium]